MMRKIVGVITYLGMLLYNAPLALAQKQVDLAKEYPFGNIKSLGEGISYLIVPAFTICGTAVLLYFIFASFKLVMSGGDKNEVAAARNMITHAIIGFVILMMMFLIYEFFMEFFGIKFDLIQWR